MFDGGEALEISSERWRGSWRSGDRVDATRGHVSISSFIVHQTYSKERSNQHAVLLGYKNLDIFLGA